MTAPTPCGCGCPTTDKGTKISHALAGRSYSPDTLKRMSESQRRRFAGGVPQAHREAMSRGTRGIPHSPDCGHCVAVRGPNHPRWNNGSSQKDIRRRLAQHGGMFDPLITRLAVLDRDAWVCQICGEAIPDIPWDNDRFQPKYGTIDHITPISRHGDHVWDNVRAAHLRCNADEWYAMTRQVSE